MTRRYFRVTRQTAALVVSRTGLPVLVVTGIDLGVRVLQKLGQLSGQGTAPEEEQAPDKTSHNEKK
jgi:hypothetical protein